MFKRLGRYARIYSQFVSNCVATEMSFRVNFASLLFMEIVYFFIMIAGIKVYFSHIDQIGSWGEPEFLFFTSMVIFIDITFLTFFASNFWQFADDIRTGNLDFVLTKPVSTLFMVFCRKIRTGGLVTMIWMAGVVAYFGRGLPEAWTLERIGTFALFLIAAIMLKVGLEILVGTLMFITVEGEAVNMFRLNLQVIQKQPDFIYGVWLRTALSFFYPLLLVTSMPGHMVLDRTTPPWGFVAFFFFAIFYIWFVVRIAWRKGLDTYESASS